MTSSSSEPTLIKEQDEETQLKKSNRISTFFSSLFSWKSADKKQGKSTKRKTSKFKKYVEPTNNEDFGVEQTETLQHFAKPRPPSNRRRPMTTKKSKVTPMTNIKEDEEEPSDLQISRELPPKVEIQEIEEEKVQLRSQVMRQLSNSLRSKSLSDTPPNVVNSDSTSIKPRAGSDIFTQRFKSHNTEGIENPTSL